MSPTFRSLAIRNYRIYAAGAFLSNTGTWLQRVAQDWLVLQLTAGSGTALGITTGLQFLPMLLATPLAGVVADRFPKRKVLACTQVAMAVPAAVLGVLAVTGAAQPWMVYVIAFVFGTATAFDAPARQSFVVEMVGQDDLANAVGLNSASFNAARIVGPALAGLMIAALGGGVEATGWVILLNAASYGAVLVSLRLLRVRDLHPVELASRGRGAVRQGISYVRSRPDIMLILAVVFFVGTFGLNFQMTMALMATEVYGKGAGEFGILGSAMAVGSLTGSLLAARRANPRLRIVVGAAVVFSFAEIISGLLPTYLTFALWLPVLGLCALTMITSANATVQLTTTPVMRGRVAALYLMIFMGGTPVGAPIVGWAAEQFGARTSLVASGVITLLGTLGAVVWYVRHRGLVVRPRFGAHPGWEVRIREEQLARERLRETEQSPLAS